jgi:uncharacterized membrane protein (DUF4010 family)
MDIGFLHSNGIEALPQFLTSLAIGLLIGLERERNPSAKAGLRTFALVAVLGTLMAMLSDKFGSPWLLIAGLLAVAGTIIAAYLNTPEEDNADPGTTTVIALLLCYGLGAMIWSGLPTLAVMLAIGITALLYFKPELRGFSQQMTRRDLVSILQFSVLSFVILPILPNQDYGPYQALNPHQAWMMVVMISGLSLTGYVALRLTGQRYGAPLLGLFGGLASSTATTLIYAKRTRNKQPLQNFAASVIVIASMAVLVRLIAVCWVFASASLPMLLPPFFGGLLGGGVVALYGWRKLSRTTEDDIPKTANPAELHTAIGFGLLYVAVLFVSAWMVDIAGSQGLYAVAVASGLTDVDAIVLSSLRLFNLAQLSEQQAAIAIALAFLSNLAFKFAMVVFIGGRALARQVAAGFGAIACGVLSGLLFL